MSASATAAIAYNYDLVHPHSLRALEKLPQDPQTQQLWRHLLMCLETPRPSNSSEERNELKLMTEKLLQWGKNHSLDCAVDAAGNIRLRRKASPGYENATKIVLQSHIDVVCSKSNDKVHDFTKDPVIPIVEGNILRADRTTLGADDGIGVASSMAILECKDPDFVHGQLEAVFTVDEETTMGGAEFIGKDLLDSQVMINVDSEEAHSICVGCAGGFEKKIDMPITRSAVPQDKTVVKMHLHSLLGGHTGIDIHKGRASALQVIARLLYACVSQDSTCGCGVQLISLTGGNAPNAIPRDATVEVAVLSSKVECFKTCVNKQFARIQKEFEFIERVPAADSTEQQPKWKSCMVLDITPAASASSSSAAPLAITLAETKRVLQFMLNLPHGPLKQTKSLIGEVEVETSISFSIVTLPSKSSGSAAPAVDSCTFHLFSRSSYDDDMKDVDTRLQALAELSGCTTTSAFNKFPGWDPKLDSPALAQVIETHKRLFEGKEARVYSVHAGLECGLFKLAYPNLDCVSIGPTIEHAHSPQEQLLIDTVAPFYAWLKQSIVAIAKDSIKK